MDSPIVTLTSDWSSNDYYVGRVKGRLYSMIPNVRVVDITHELPTANRMAASFVVKNACCGFPQGTVHIVDVAGLRSADEVLVIEAYDQYYIMFNDGLPYLIFGKKYSRAVSIDKSSMPQHGRLVAYDLYCDLAARITAGINIDNLGKSPGALQAAASLDYKLSTDGLHLTAYVTYVDSYGNAYLDISYTEFEILRAGRQFRVGLFGTTITRIGNIGEGADDLVSVEPVLSVATTGSMMIGMSMASENASRLFGLSVYSKVSIDFS